MTLYQEVKQAGIKHDSYRSDLYILASVEAKRLLKKHEVKPWPSTFVCNVDKRIYYDVPFAFDPYWESRTTKKRPYECGLCGVIARIVTNHEKDVANYCVNWSCSNYNHGAAVYQRPPKLMSLCTDTVTKVKACFYNNDASTKPMIEVNRTKYNQWLKDTGRVEKV